jgi:lantibiotic transport system permease protein
MTVFTILRSEILKSKRTAAFYLTLAGAVPIPAIFLLNVLTGGGDLKAISKDPINAIFEMGAERNGVLFFPMFVILICTMLPQIEYRNHTWKQVLAAPVTKANLFLAKLLNMNLLVLLFLVASIFFMLVAIVITHIAHPSLNVLSQPFDPASLFLRTANTYATMVAVCSIQFWLGLRFRNFIAPVGIGIALWFTGMMMMFEFKSPMVEFFPYAFYLFPYMQENQSKMPQVALISAGYAVVFLLLAFLDFRKRKMG